MDMKPYFDFLKEKLEECLIQNPGSEIGKAANDGYWTMYHYGCCVLLKISDDLLYGKKEEGESA